MHIVVCAKQVPDTGRVEINEETGSLIRDDVRGVMNPDDAHAVEMALSIKDAQPDAHVTIVTMGPEKAYDLLFEGIAMGADDGILLQDERLAGSDTWGTAYALSCIIKKIGDVDLVLTGRETADGVTAQVGPEMAEHLGLPQATCVDQFKSLEDGKVLQVYHKTNIGHDLMEISMPCLLTVTAEMNKPRYMSMAGIFSKKKDVTIWTAEDAGIDLSKVGHEGAMIKVIETFVPKRERHGEEITARDKEGAVSYLLTELKRLRAI